MIISILGAPGSGKGTQANLLAEKLKIPAISVGHLLREEVAKGTKDGLEANKYMVRGDWVSDEITIRVLTNRLLQPDVKNGFIIDAFPRLLTEKRLLDAYLAKKGKSLNLVFNLNVDDEECLRRIRIRRQNKGGKKTVRQDESDKVTLKRIALHHKTSKPILGEFKSEGKLIEIDGNRSIDEIQEDMYKYVKEIL